MKTNIIITALVLFSLLLANCTKESSSLPKPMAKEATKSASMSHADMVKRGAYIVSTSACDDCHTPKKMTDKGPVFDMSLRLSGHRTGSQLAVIKDKSILKDYALCNMELTGWIGPWGTSYAANLTPDDTGLGSWSPEQFKKAIKEGKFKGLDGGRPIMPPMPWEVYRNSPTKTWNASSPFYSRCHLSKTWYQPTALLNPKFKYNGTGNQLKFPVPAQFLFPLNLFT